MNNFWFAWALIAASQWVLFPLLQIWWKQRKQKRQEQQEKKWQEENKVLDERERRELYRQATKHADRVYVIRKFRK